MWGRRKKRGWCKEMVQYTSSDVEATIPDKSQWFVCICIYYRFHSPLVNRTIRPPPKPPPFPLSSPSRLSLTYSASNKQQQAINRNKPTNATTKLRTKSSSSLSSIIPFIMSVLPLLLLLLLRLIFVRLGFLVHNLDFFNYFVIFVICFCEFNTILIVCFFINSIQP